MRSKKLISILLSALVISSVVLPVKNASAEAIVKTRTLEFSEPVSSMADREKFKTAVLKNSPVEGQKINSLRGSDIFNITNVRYFSDAYINTIPELSREYNVVKKYLKDSGINTDSDDIYVEGSPGNNDNFFYSEDTGRVFVRKNCRGTIMLAEIKDKKYINAALLDFDANNNIIYKSVNSGWYHITFSSQDNWTTGFEVSPKWVYIKPDTDIAYAEWLNLNNKWYFFSHDAAMQAGVYYLGAMEYYFDENGVMQTGWVQMGLHNWAYYRPDGSRVYDSFVDGYLIENGIYDDYK